MRRGKTENATFLPLLREEKLQSQLSHRIDEWVYVGVAQVSSFVSNSSIPTIILMWLLTWSVSIDQTPKNKRTRAVLQEMWAYLGAPGVEKNNIFKI